MRHLLEEESNFILTILSLLDAEDFAAQKEWTEALNKLYKHKDCWRILWSQGLNDAEHMYILTEWRFALDDPAQRTAFAWTGLGPMLKDAPQAELLMLDIGGYSERPDEVHELIIITGDDRVADAKLIHSMLELHYATVPTSLPLALPQHLKSVSQGELQVDELYKYSVLCTWVSMEGMQAFKDPAQETFDQPDDWERHIGRRLKVLPEAGATVESRMLQLRYWPPQR